MDGREARYSAVPAAEIVRARGSLQSFAHLKHRPSIGTNVNFSHLRPGLQNPMSAAPQCHTLRFAMAGSARA